MTRPSEDDRAAIDRAFAEMMAGYHLTAERPSDVAAGEAVPGAPATATEPAADAPAPVEPDGGWADQHPLFHFPAEDQRQAAPEVVEEPTVSPPPPA